MKRRAFLTAAGVAGLAPLTAIPTHAQTPGGRDLFEIRQYILETEEQKKLFDAYMKEAAIPALNRMGIAPVGVFFAENATTPAYVILRHKSMESFLSTTQKLMADAEHLQKGAAFWNAPAAASAFKRMESSLFLAFKGMPTLETPVKSPGRVYQLRIYESPSVKTGQKKIEMFNDAGEIKIFREVGLNPVFFGEALVGTKLPNLTYMLGFESAEDMKAAWKKFGGHPEWKKLKGMAEYADKEILCGITNIVLKPAEYSQF